MTLAGDQDEAHPWGERLRTRREDVKHSGWVAEVLTEFCGALRTRNAQGAADFEERLTAYKGADIFDRHELSSGLVTLEHSSLAPFCQALDDPRSRRRPLLFPT
jgi:hypothetical protein